MEQRPPAPPRTPVVACPCCPLHQQRQHQQQEDLPQARRAFCVRFVGDEGLVHGCAGVRFGWLHQHRSGGLRRRIDRRCRCGFACAPEAAVGCVAGGAETCFSARRSLTSTQSFIMPADTRAFPRAGPSITSAMLRSRSTHTRSPTRTASASSAAVSTGSGSNDKRWASISPRSLM